MPNTNSEYHLCWNETERFFLILSKVQVLDLHLYTFCKSFVFFSFCAFSPFSNSKLEINILIDSSSHSRNESCEKFMRVFNIS